MDESIKLILKKVMEKEDKGPAHNHFAENTPKHMSNETKKYEDLGTLNTDWTNFKIEPFPNHDDDEGFLEDMSDDEGYYHEMDNKKSKSPKGPLKGMSFVKIEHDMLYKKDKGQDLKVFASNFKRGKGLSDSRVVKEEDGVEMATIEPRKLSYTPPSAYKRQKSCGLDPPTKYTPRRRPPSKEVSPKGTTSKDNQVMQVGRGSANVTKILLTKIGKTVGRRRDLVSLCPDQAVDQQCEMLSNMVGSNPYPAGIFSPYYELESWDIIAPNGLPKITQGQVSAIWVLDWMSMGDAFTVNVSPEMTERTVKMRIALDLVQGEHNDYWEDICGKSEAFWHRIRTQQAH
ncbi:hypothetical protein SESBI_31821 [Sesbania bispinosa]|nr:hypothetical protein SESBI_31821 [Sesbania bispinosa]